VDSKPERLQDRDSSWLNRSFCLPQLDWICKTPRTINGITTSFGWWSSEWELENNKQRCCPMTKLIQND
jgi:hypothetical protein